VEELEERATPSQFTWSGLGTDALWSDGANWVGGAVPAPKGAGDPVNLIFPAGAAQLNNTNNLATVFNSITLGDSPYNIGGQPITVNGAITANNQAAHGINFNCPLVLHQAGGSQSIVVTNDSAVMRFTQALTNPGAAGLAKSGLGTLSLNGDNSGFSGAIVVQAGALVAVSSTALGTSPQGTTVQANAALWLAPSNLNSTNFAEPMSLTGGGIGGTGALRALSGAPICTGAVTLLSNVTMGVDGSGTLALDGAIGDGGKSFGITKTLTGTLLLSPTASSTYLGLTQVNQGTVEITKDGALGGAKGAGTVVAAGATLEVNTDNSPTITEPITLNGTGIPNFSSTLITVGNTGTSAIWNAPITLGSNVAIAAQTGTSLTLAQPIGDGGAGFGVTLNGGGTVTYTGAGANTYTGLTSVASGLLSLNKSGGAHAFAGPLQVGGAGASAESLWNGSNQLPANASVTVNPLGLVNLNNSVDTVGTLDITGGTVNVAGAAASLTLAGNLTATSSTTPALVNGAGTLALSAATHTFEVDDGPSFSDLVVSARVTGATGDLSKTGAGRLELNAVNTYRTTTIVQGDVEVDPATASVGAVVLSGGSLSGTGSVGALSGPAGAVGSGTVDAGIHGGPAPQFGTLTAHGNVTLGPTSVLVANLSNGTSGNPRPGVDYDVLTTTGNAIISGTVLSGNTGAGVQIGNTFTILQATGTVTGQLVETIGGVQTALGNGSTALIGGLPYQIAYGAHNVVLTRVAPGPTSIVIVAAANPSVSTQGVAFTATIIPSNTSAGAPTGTVTFSVDGVAQPSVPVSGGMAVFNATNLAPGLRHISAVYNGDPIFAASATASDLLESVTSSPNGVIATAVPIGNVGRAGLGANETLVLPTDVDFFSFNVVAGQLVTFETTGDVAVGVDTFLRLFDGTGTQLAFNDDGPTPGKPGSRDASFSYLFTRAGTYYIAVSGYPNYHADALTGANVIPGSTGDYGLSVFLTPPTPDPDATLRQATPLGSATQMRQIQYFLIQPATDIDMFSFSVAARQTVTLTVTRGVGSSLIPQLRLFDAHGHQLARTGNSATITFQFATAGTYFVGVTGRGNDVYNPITGAGTRPGSTGGFTITLIPGRIAKAEHLDRLVAQAPLLMPHAIVSGVVYFDQNASGQRDPGDTGEAGHTVFLDLFNKGVQEDGDPATITNSQGQFVIIVPLTGRQPVFAAPLVQDGYTVEKITSPSRGFYSVLLNPRKPVSNLAFGMAHYEF
jgi:autotransporter-associated beta strand protein